MDFGERREGAGVSFQIAPLIDVVFLLLIWMIATYAIVREERSLAIRLPRADAAVETPRTGSDLVVNIDAAGNMTHAGEAYTLDALARRLARLREYTKGLGPDMEPGVVIAADAATELRFVVAVFDLCRRLDIARVVIQTLPRGEGDAAGA